MCYMNILLVIIVICCAKYVFADTVCGDWQTFRDEKCFNVFKYVQTYDEAVNTCSQFNSTLVTITSIEEQHFIENYLFTNHKIIENVWTGLKYIDSKYKWINGLVVNYTNWSEGSPKNMSDYCTQINSDELLLGKWTDISCAKRNVAFCQKEPNVTLSTQQLMNMFITTKNLLENTIQQLSNKLENTSKELLMTNTRLETTENRLEKTNKQLDYFFSNKWINFKTFVENNTRKALIYPYKPQHQVLRTDAIEICKQSNATLVDIESEEKQKLVHSFLYEINPKLDYYYYYTGGSIDSSSGRHKWANSGNEFSFTNWASNNNRTELHYVVITSIYGDSNDGKWYSVGNSPYNVFCEITFNIQIVN